MFRKLAAAVLLGLSLVATLASAQVVKDQDEIALDQKLKRVYELYRVGETVTLRPHEFRIGVGVDYSFDETERLGIRTRTRAVGTNATIGFGVSKWLEVQLVLPMQGIFSRIDNFGTDVRHRDVIGFGGMGLQFTAALPTKVMETALTFGVTLPSGDRRLGANHMQSLLGLNVAKQLRPAFIYGGISWGHDWDATRDSIGYIGGVGFYLNHALSLGGELSGQSFIQSIPHGNQDIFSTSFRLAYQATPDFGINASFSHGLTVGAPNITINLNVVRRF